MKKHIALLLVMAIIFSLSSCGKEDNIQSTSSEPEEMDFSEFQWPDTEIAKLLPVPKSTVGNVKWSETYGFVIYVSETPLEDYTSYVEECEDCGFTFDVNKGDTYFYADNSDGYHVALKYQDGDVMFVRIDDPEEESAAPTAKPTIEPTPSSKNTPTSKPTEPPVKNTPEVSSTPDRTQNESSSASTPKPSEESSSSDDYSDSSHRSKAVQAFENYGDYICPYGIKYHWFDTNISEYEGNGVWHFKVGVTITNQFDATRDAVAEGRVSFIAEEVTEFELLDDWD